MSESFEDEVVSYTAHLPSATLEAEEEYARGTILTLNVQVRVIGFTENEDKKGNLIHKHNLALEEVSIADVLTPAQRKALIEAAEREAEEQARLAAGATISEEQHIEDVLPGQTTIDEQLESVKYDYVPTKEDLGVDPPHDAANDEDDVDGEPVEDFLADVQEKIDAHAPRTAQLDDEDDHEHDWMDEEEEFAHGVRVEYVGF